MGIPLSKYSIMAKAIGCLDDDLPATCKGRGLGYSCLITGTLNWVKANVKRQSVVLIWLGTKLKQIVLKPINMFVERLRTSLF